MPLLGLTVLLYKRHKHVIKAPPSGDALDERRDLKNIQTEILTLWGACGWICTNFLGALTNISYTSILTTTAKVIA